MKPVAFVIPWFGESLKGGAEQLAWQVSNRLAARGHSIEVLTTCCASFLDDWSQNNLPHGLEKNGNLVIRRFKVDKRDSAAFNTANSLGLAVPPEKLKPGVNPFPIGRGEQFAAENINSFALEKYLQRNVNRYNSFIFLPYLYGVILHGLPKVADKSWLQPCLHDEVYAYLPAVEICMRKCKGILYNSLGEEKLAHFLYGPGIMRKGQVVGVGVENLGMDYNQLPHEVSGHKLKSEPYILCLGRRDATKNTRMLVDAYQNFRNRYPDSALKLILAGPGEEKFGLSENGVHDLGLVSEKYKEALIANCTALFQPSRNESYSRVIMEAWFYQKPVAAHGECLATAMAVSAAKGGLLAQNPDEWSSLFSVFADMDESQRQEIGSNGREYARQFAEWDAVIDRYEIVLGLGSSETDSNTDNTPIKVKTINQLTPGFAYGDAISNQAIIIREILRKRGYRSEIFTEHLDPVMVNEAKLFEDGRKIQSDQGLIYHHSIGAGLTDFVIKHSGPKGLVYHNVTPPDLVRKYETELAKILEQGLTDLKVLAPHFPACCGDSQFNSKELEENGFTHPSVLPICVSPEKWNIQADPNTMAKLQDGKDNILFVGRLVANKCQHDLIDAFAAYRDMYGNCRLILVGGFIEEENYYQSLLSKVRSHGLLGDVVFAGKVPDTILHACYRCSHLFWSMSEHEGFGVPLIESMWFDLPVFAYKSTAVPETIGPGGILFTEKNNIQKLAVTAKLLIHDQELRNKVISAQQMRREDFLPESIEPKLNAFIRGMNA